MNEKVENLILEHLRALRADIQELREGQRMILNRLNVMESHIAGLVVSEVHQNAEIADLRQRIERVEARLDLRDH